MDRQYYDEFVQRVIACETPSLGDILTARQQFVDESDTNVLQAQLLDCLEPFIKEVTDEQVPYWGLIMCSLFEIHIAATQLGVCKDD